jgi:hypothetical protein
MPMFKKNLKLIATAIGLVTVLVMGLAMPGATQQNPLSRASVVNAISNVVAATLTAAEGDVFDMDNAKFYSDNRLAFAYLPLHPASRSLKLLEERLEDLFAGRAVNVEISALYLPEDVPGFLKAGTYKMKLVDRTRVVLVDQEGQEVFSGKVESIWSLRPLANNNIESENHDRGPLLLQGHYNDHHRMVIKAGRAARAGCLGSVYPASCPS